VEISIKQHSRRFHAINGIINSVSDIGKWKIKFIDQEHIRNNGFEGLNDWLISIRTLQIRNRGEEIKR